MSVESFVPMGRYLDWAIDEAVFHGPGAQRVATPKLVRRPSSVEVSSIDDRIASVLQFCVDPRQTEVPYIINWGFGDVVPMAPRLYLSPEASRVVFHSIVGVRYGPVSPHYRDGSVCRAKREAR